MSPSEVEYLGRKFILYPALAHRQATPRAVENMNLRRVLHAMLADTPLMKNLENPEYMHLLLNGKKTLEEVFSDLEINGFEPTSSTSHDVTHCAWQTRNQRFFSAH